MKVKLLLIFVLFLFSFQMNAQSASQAENLFNNKKFKDAAKAYETLLKRRPNDHLLNYRYGRCMLELRMFDKAIEHLNKAGNKYPAKDFYLADAMYKNYDFVDALDLMKQYLTTIDSTDASFVEIKQKLPAMELTAKLINRVEDIVITDSLLVDKKDFLKYYDLSSEAGKLSQKTFPVGARMLDEISYFTQRGSRHIRSLWMNGHWDIATSIKLLDDWSDPVSISNQINTRANENYPFLLSDGVTLYFASDGHGSIGGYDIFVTKYASSSEDFLIPENVGFPFNSFANDYMMALDDVAQTGWFATDRNQKSGKVMIYQFKLTQDKIFVAVDDSIHLKNIARLKSYRKGILSNSKPKNITTTDDIVRETSKMYFEVNDSVIYTDKSQFKNPDALKMFNDWKKTDDECKRINSFLVKLRSDYENSQNETDKISLSTSILQNEDICRELYLKSTELLKSVRLEENKKISIP